MSYKKLLPGLLTALLITGAFLFTNTDSATAAPQVDKGTEKQRVIITFDNSVGDKERAFVRSQGGDLKYSYASVPAIAARVPEQAIDNLSRNPNIVRIEEDKQVEALDVELDNSWGVKHIGAGEAHTDGESGSSVRVGVIDSGVNYNHPDLDDNYAGGYDFYYYDDDPMDVYGHGTHVAGTICAEDNDNGTQVKGEPHFGVVGVVPDCDLYSLRVLDEDGVGYWSDIMAAVEWSTGEEVYLEAWGDTAATTTQGTRLDVINLSLGKDGDPGETARQVFANAYEKGVLIVAAAGNSGNKGGNNNSTIYPAKFDSVIAVGATDDTDTRADFSSTGDEVELAAPGVDVYSTWNDDTPYYGESVCDGTVEDTNGDGYPEGECYKYGSGTSMASPHVAGIAALVMGAGVTDYNGDGVADNKDVRAILQDTADDLGDFGRDIRYGFGLVNAPAALDVLDPTDTPPSVTMTSPQDGDIVSGTVSLTADATDDDAVVEVEFYYDSTLISTDTTAPYEASWDSTVVPGGDYELWALAADASYQYGTDSVNVTVENANDAPVAEAGSDQTHQDIDADGSEFVTLDGSNSYDPNGSITSYAWYQESALVATGSTPTLNLDLGDYNFDLVVTDNDGATSTDSVAVRVIEAVDIQLDTNIYKEKGRILTDLSWSGSEATDVEIYRDGSLIDTVANNGSYTDQTGQKGNASFTYQVCEAGSTICSNESTVSTR